MELPIYQENLRSSGDWLAGLSQAREAWAMAKAQPETIARVREWQTKQCGAEALSAAHKIADWAAEADARLDVSRLLELNRALTNGEILFREAETTPLNAAHDPPLAPPCSALTRQCNELVCNGRLCRNERRRTGHARAFAPA